MFSETANQLEVCKCVFKLLLVCLNWKLETPVPDVFLLCSCFPRIFRNTTQCFSSDIVPVFIYIYYTYQKHMKVCLHLKVQNIIVCMHICVCVYIYKNLCNLFSFEMLFQIPSVIFFSYGFFSTSKEVNRTSIFDIRTEGLSLLTSFLVEYWWLIFGSRGL